MSKVEAPGLRWKDKRSRPVWHARADAVKVGYLPKIVDLSHLSGDADLLRLRCALLQADLNYWMAAHRKGIVENDGTIASMVTAYQTHPESPFHRLRPTTIETYNSHLGYVRAMIGGRPVASVTGLDVIRWDREWSTGGKHLAKAQQMRVALLSACSFGAALKFEGAADLARVIRETRRTFGSPKPRTQLISASQVDALRLAAHEVGFPSRALAYAIVFETTLRLWDVTGQWWPAGRQSSKVIDDVGRGWLGLRWEDIDDDLVLRFVPSKTAGSTGKSISFPLAAAPMVMEELRHSPVKNRVGPVIINERTQLPYTVDSFQHGWRRDRTKAKLPFDLWARDLRASGITEGRSAGATLDDASKVAGHAGVKTTGDVYDRALLSASTRFAEARRTFRSLGNGNA